MRTDVSKYLLLDRVAVGGMAEVYRAKSLGVEGFEKIIAIKRILPMLAEDSEFVSMFIEEAKIAGQLSHANIAPIYELGKIDDTHFIAMEYVWGKDLLHIVERHKRMKRTVPPPMAAWIASRMLEGLDYAHRKRGVDGRPLAIIHRDVSPQNIIVSYDGLVKLIDFGIAKAASRATQTQAGIVKGKLGYMSPEQITGLQLDHRSDIFAVSTCLWEMLTCERLFAGRNDIEVIDKVRMARVDPPSQLGVPVPPQLEAVLMKGLARSTSDRYSTAGEMQEELMRFIAMSRPPFGTARLGEWMRTAFAPEIADEKAHLDRLTGVAQPGQRVREPEPELGGFEDHDDEDTIMAMSPFDLHAPAPARDSGGVEVSVVVTVESVERQLAAPPAGHLPPPAPRVPLPPAARPPAPRETAPQTHLPAHGYQPYAAPAQEGQAPMYAPQPAAAYAPTAPLPLPDASLGVEVDEPDTVPRMSAPSGLAPAPQLPGHALSSPGASAAPASAPEESNRFMGCLVALLVVAVLMSAAAVGFWLTGGDAILRDRAPAVRARFESLFE